jgi:hypothetical protein
MARTTFSGPVKSDNGFEGAIVGNVTGNVVGNLTGSVDASAGTVRIVSALLSALPPATVAGRLLYVSNANTGAGTVAFSNGSAWIDIKTGLAVA